MVVKTEIYFATRKTANAHVFIKKAEKGREGSVRVNNVPIDMVEPEMAREVILVPLEIGISEKIEIKLIFQLELAEAVLWVNHMLQPLQ